MGQRGLRIVPRTDKWLERELARAEGESPTYPEVGDRWNPIPSPPAFGLTATTRRWAPARPLSSGLEGLRTWQAHRLRGLSICPSRAPIEVGVTVLVCVGRGLVVPAPCRIVKVLDEADRWGFAYGTLPGHPEQGEEAFVVSLDPEGSVRFEIRAFSRPASRLVELSGPIGRSVQRRATEGYLASLIRHVSG
jgi:uncharacterized protein (UPF0548 family)